MFGLLWIAFRIVFLLMIPNESGKVLQFPMVVNCFQNCIFTYDSQLNIRGGNLKTGCELLSELYFYLWFPTSVENVFVCVALWIAFRIVFLLMIPNETNFCKKKRFVVNCFQNCIFTYDSQRKRIKSRIALRCELLSELYFYLWFPTSNENSIVWLGLWIAFRIVFLLMIPNNN